MRIHDSSEKKRGSWKAFGGGGGRGEGIPLAPGIVDKPASQLGQGESAPINTLPKSLPSA